jgi:glycosyltransferase involved in cell wall biosynthesis
LGKIQACILQILSLPFIHGHVRTTKYDLIYVRNDPIFGAFASYISAKYAIPFILQLSHFKEEQLLVSARRGIGGNRFGNFVKGTLGTLFKNWILSRADLIFPISDWMKQSLAYQGISVDKMIALPLGGDVRINPDRISGDEIRTKLNLQGKRVLVYVGAMDRIRRLEFLLNVLKIVENQIDDGVKLLMVGDSKDKGDMLYLRQVAKELNIEQNVVFVGRIPRCEVPRYIKVADLGVSPIPPYSFYMASSPTKTLEYMTLAKPVVCNNIPDQREVITQSSAGLCVDYDEHQFASAIVELLANPKRAQEMGRAGRRYVEERRNYSLLADKAENACINLISLKDATGGEY